MSLPVRGAWIEIFSWPFSAFRDVRRSPCGERGLKCSSFYCGLSPIKSLPVRGAWIEMTLAFQRYEGGQSLPVRGAWIEICFLFYIYILIWSLPVRGAWIEIRKRCGYLDGLIVAPRAGSVD